MEIKYKTTCREWKWHIKLYKCSAWDFFIIKNYKLINDLKKKQCHIYCTIIQEIDFELTN